MPSCVVTCCRQPKQRSKKETGITYHSNLDSLLNEIYVDYVALKDEDFERYYGVFSDLLRQILIKMKEVDPYFKAYSSNIQLAGSHYDRLRITKPTEFDVNIVIGLPLDTNENPNNKRASDIVFVPRQAGFLQLRTNERFERICSQNKINETICEWTDEQGFLLRSYFMDWFKSVVDKALNLFPRYRPPSYRRGYYRGYSNFQGRPRTIKPRQPTRIIESNGIQYTVRKSSESGPAYTLTVEHRPTNFRLDVDLVPALKFPEDRWPISNSYRPIRSDWSDDEKIFLVVPKPIKSAYSDSYETSRSWRLGLHVQERNIMYDSANLRQVTRLLKKLRDAQNMDEIASYYIKTLALHEFIEKENVPGFWNQNLSVLFPIMVKKFYNAVNGDSIPYFWNGKNDLIKNIDRATLNGYAAKLRKLVRVLQNPKSYDEDVARFLLTKKEFSDFFR